MNKPLFIHSIKMAALVEGVILFFALSISIKVGDHDGMLIFGILHIFVSLIVWPFTVIFDPYNILPFYFLKWIFAFIQFLLFIAVCYLFNNLLKKNKYKSTSSQVTNLGGSGKKE